MPTDNVRHAEIERELIELRRRNEELEKSQARYQSLFEHAPISLWEEDYSRVREIIEGLRQEGVTDFRAYFESRPDVVGRCAELVRVRDVNRTTLRMYHAESKEQLFAGISTVFGEETFADFREQLIAFAAGDTLFECEATTYTLDRARKRILLSILISAGYEQTWERCFVAIQDVTERALAEEMARRTLTQEETIEAQRAALGALATPIIPISDDTLVVPLIGVLDSQRMAQVTTALLHEVGQRRATTAIVDITGVPLVDTAVANTLIRAAQAVRLLGARVVLTGIRPEVAQILVGLGVYLGGIVTQGTLQAGIAYAARKP